MRCGAPDILGLCTPRHAPPHTPPEALDAVSHGHWTKHHLQHILPQVDVDVYRRVQPVRSEPLAGAASFFQEGLLKWRELNCAAVWLDVASRLHPVTQSLPQLLHHKGEVLGLLLGGIAAPDAALSLPPLFDLVAQLARDLQDEFVPLFPSVAAR